jgi:hypothetical protein
MGSPVKQATASATTAAASTTSAKPAVEQFNVPMEASQLLFQLTLADCPQRPQVETSLMKVIETNRKTID